MLLVSRGTRVVILVTVSISVLTAGVAYLYYGAVNRYEDPRILAARHILSSYDNLPQQVDLIERFHLLDSAASVFKSIPDYAHSYEMGIVLNNKASALILEALYDTAVSIAEKETQLEWALVYVDSSITLYRSWMSEWTHLTKAEVEKRVRTSMHPGDPAFKGLSMERLISRRVKSQLTAQIETPRRLSVSLSNKGIIYRHLKDYEASANCFAQSLALWKHNRVAKSNLSVLMGGKPVKPGIIESLFPPDRNKTDSGN